MLRKMFFFITLFCCAAAFFCPAAEPGKNAKKEKTDDPYPHIATLMQAVMMIRNSYADKEKVSYEKLFRGAMKGMLHELDPFSRYETPKDFKSTLEDSKGEFAGIGVVLSLRDKKHQIVSVMKDSPAMKAGLKPGDILLEANGKKLQGLSLSECVTILKGPPGTIFSAKYYRPTNDSTHTTMLKRAVIRVSSVKGIGMLPGGKIGYLRITQFTATTARDLDNALKELSDKGMEALVIDLRNNPGGLLDSGVNAASRFIEKGSPVLSVEGRAAKPRKYYAVDCVRYDKLPITLLVNGFSASAAEIMAGALKDYNRAVLIGSKTFGKGSVQTLLPLSDNGALRLTTAKYYTPKRLAIHGNGITPNIEVPMTPLETIAVSSEMSMNSDKPPKTVFGKFRDKQLIRAEEILKGILIYRKSMENK